MKALESFEIQSWNALWVFKYKIHRQQTSVHCNTTIHDKAENLKIQHINSYLFLWTATYNSLANSLSRVTFDLIPCPEQNAWTEIDEKPKHQNRYLCNIYIHAQDRKNFREFSLKIKTYFRSTLFYFVKRIDQKTCFSASYSIYVCKHGEKCVLEFRSITSKIFLWHWFCIKTKM